MVAKSKKQVTIIVILPRSGRVAKIKAGDSMPRWNAALNVVDEWAPSIFSQRQIASAVMKPGVMAG